MCPTAAMATPRMLFSAWALAVILFANSVTAWKEMEFRKCDQSKFCKDVREGALERSLGEKKVESRDVKLDSEGRLTARLVQDGNEHETLALQLSAYRDGIVRVKVAEERAPHKRFEVPDVLNEDLEEKRLWISQILEKEGASLVRFSGYDVVLHHKPFQVSQIYHRQLNLIRQYFWIVDFKGVPIGVTLLWLCLKGMHGLPRKCICCRANLSCLLKSQSTGTSHSTAWIAGETNQTLLG
jgi:hypothetical protein